MERYQPITKCQYGTLDPKVNLEPDFFTGFQPERREEIVREEAKFYHDITRPYSVDHQIDTYYLNVKAEDGYQIPVKVYAAVKGVCDRLIEIHSSSIPSCMFSAS